MFDTLEALQERAPSLELPLGRAQAILTPLIAGGVALALLLWVGSVSPLGGLICFVVFLAGGAFLVREALAGAQTRPYEGALLYQLLPLLGLHAALLLGIALTSGEGLVPAWLAWPVFFYLLLSGLALLGRSLSEAGLGRWLLLQPEPPEGALHQTLLHPALGGLARVALGLAVANGSAMAMLLAVLYAWVLLPGWARALVPLRPVRTAPRLWPSSLLGEARLLASLIDPLGPARPADDRDVWSDRPAPPEPVADEQPVIDDEADDEPLEFTDEDSGFSDETSEAEVIERVEHPAKLPTEE